MVLKYVYYQYCQKSKCFLYPYLGIRKDSNIRPIETYISWEDKYSVMDRKLIALYKSSEEQGYRTFEKKILMNNPLYHTRFECEDDKTAYIFSFDKRESDWENFLQGKYSRLSDSLKQMIIQYHGKDSGEYAKSWLYPHEYFTIYAQLLKGCDYAPHLDITVKDLYEVGELCDKYDPKRENLSINVLELVELNNLL